MIDPHALSESWLFRIVVWLLSATMIVWWAMLIIAPAIQTVDEFWYEGRSGDTPNYIEVAIVLVLYGTVTLSFFHVIANFARRQRRAVAHLLVATVLLFVAMCVIAYAPGVNGFWENAIFLGLIMAPFVVAVSVGLFSLQRFH